MKRFTDESVAKLLREVETLADAIGEYERRHCETLARVNALGGRMDKIMDALREILDAIRGESNG